MKIIVLHPKGASGGGLAMHAEKLLRRVLDQYCFSIDLIEVKMETATNVAGRFDYRCDLKTKLISDDYLRASASDCEAILAVYRAADRVKFLLAQRLQSENKR